MNVLIRIFPSMLFILAACTSKAAEPPATYLPSATKQPSLTNTMAPSETATITPTETPRVPATHTITPTSTHLPATKTPTTAGLGMPSGTPMTSWQGFPIMPDALAGEASGNGYSFTVEAESSEVQVFYESKLGVLGWDLLASGKGVTGAIIMIFTKGGETFSVSIIPQPEGILYVMLIK